MISRKLDEKIICYSNRIHVRHACNKHNAPTEIHTFFEGTRSTVAAPCGAVKNGANDPPRPTTQPFYGSEQRLCTLLYVTLKDRFTSIPRTWFFNKIFQFSYR